MSTGLLMYNNLLRDATIITDTDSVSGFPASNSLDGRTSTYTKMNAGVKYITYDLGSAKNFSHIFIARHNFDSTNTFVAVYVSSDNIDYSTQVLSDTYVESGKNFWASMGSQTYRYIRVYTGDVSKQPQFTDISIGIPYTLDRSQKHGFIRPGLADGDRIISNVTRGQELAGLSVREGLERIVFDLPVYSEAWFQFYLDFIDSAKQYPVYIVWDISISAVPFPGKEPAFYCWFTNTLPKVKYSKDISGYYDLRLDMSGFVI